MMVTKLAHGAGSKQGASDKPHASIRDQKNSPGRQFSQNFGDFVTTCLQTDPKKVSLKQLCVCVYAMPNVNLIMIIYRGQQLLSC